MAQVAARRATRKLTTEAAAKPPAGEEQYAYGLRLLHWAGAVGIIGCIGTVKMAQEAKGEQKGQLMTVHKSFGLLMAGAIIPRVAIRLATAVPRHLPGPVWEVMAGKLTHGVLYFMLLFMPMSGIAMGYFGGKGLPFFGMHIPGAEKPVGAIAKQAFKSHKLVGQGLEIMVPLHIGAAGYHAFIKGQPIFRRMSIFRN
jgi:cytochrome b561